MAKEERELKELEGCTFAPVMYTKKRRVKEVQQNENLEGEEEVEEPEPRDINKFLEDQNRFEYEKKFK